MEKTVLTCCEKYICVTEKNHTKSNGDYYCINCPQVVYNFGGC